MENQSQNITLNSVNFSQNQDVSQIQLQDQQKEQNNKKEVEQPYQVIIQNEMKLKQDIGEDNKVLYEILLDNQNMLKLLQQQSCINYESVSVRDYSEELFQIYQDAKKDMETVLTSLDKQMNHIQYLHQQFKSTGEELEKRKFKFYKCFVKFEIPQDEQGKVEENLTDAVNQYNYVCDIANKNIPLIKFDYENLEKIRNKKVRDFVLRYNIGLVSKIKNVEYDIKNLQQKVSNIEKNENLEVSKKLDHFYDQIFQIDTSLLKQYLKNNYVPKNNGFFEQEIQELDLNTVFKKVQNFLTGGNSNDKIQQSFNQQHLAFQLNQQKQFFQENNQNQLENGQNQNNNNNLKQQKVRKARKIFDQPDQEKIKVVEKNLKNIQTFPKNSQIPQEISENHINKENQLTDRINNDKENTQLNDKDNQKQNKQNNQNIQTNLNTIEKLGLSGQQKQLIKTIQSNKNTIEKSYCNNNNETSNVVFLNNNQDSQILENNFENNLQKQNYFQAQSQIKSKVLEQQHENFNQNQIQKQNNVNYNNNNINININDNDKQQNQNQSDIKIKNNIEQFEAISEQKEEDFENTMCQSISLKNSSNSAEKDDFVQI
ncbi:hypothetical protein PPERSA_02789 [Pseudocohnilembus persalinus]|uniref:Uncharacterized protein n=1 Tax=Pseudocohnilembus persalinus TaxID=266149 RepID=A0A0V0QMC6_PSEPJ|nr:hypothetical protein PPERSA_02789 [Pseudocohnilembus persalinus]|eukprot:KRX03410.1 hypothetical protein PPERSA_02789 [Pseudocohnilembus persalinus]